MIDVTLTSILSTAVVAYIVLQFWHNCLVFLKNCPPVSSKNTLTNMETEQISENEEAVEIEDIHLSDSEDASNPSGDCKGIPLNIDYNSRVMLKEVSIEYHEGDNCDMHFKENGCDLFSAEARENKLDTSTEDLDVSDEELPTYSILNLQSVNVDSPASIAVNHSLDSVSTLNYSSSLLRQECGTDAEYISDEEISENTEHGVKERQHIMLSSGLSMADGSSVKKTSSVPLLTRQNILKNLKSTGLSPNLFSGSKDFNELWEEQNAPLMTCLEFLKSEISEDEGTDVEDISLGSFSGSKEKLCNLQNTYDLGKLSEKKISSTSVISSNGDAIDSAVHSNDRRSSAVEELTEDEIVSFENEDSESSKKRTRKRRSKHLYEKDRNTNESLTDEEFVNLENEEWTEADESGGMRQITQIKTETSIKLEGDGDSITREGDGLSRTTTTTTRIVTTVTTDQDDEGLNDQVLEDGDLRQSMHVILNQFMSDDSTPSQVDDSRIEHEE